MDLATGAFTYSQTDVVIGQPGKGGLAFTRYYRSTSGTLWANNHNGYIAVNGMTCSVVIGVLVETFTSSQSSCQGTFTADQQRGSTLDYNSTSQIFTYTMRDGTTATFSRPAANLILVDMPTAIAGVLTSITKIDGEITSYGYASEPVCIPNTQSCPYTIAALTTVTNNLGYLLVIGRTSNPIELKYPIFSVTGINTAVESCVPSTCVQTWPSAGYAYDTNGYLNFVSNAQGATNYAYTGPRLSNIQFPDSASHSVNVAYLPSGRVSSVNRGFGSWGYSYTDATDRTTTVTNPDSTARSYVSAIGSGRIQSVTNELSQTFSYQYDGAQRITRITQPEGNYTQYSYDSRGNVTEERRVSKTGAPIDIVTSAVYPASCASVQTCNKPTSTNDAAGNQTDYTYDTTHGGVLTITAPAPVSGGTRPQTRFSYAQFQARYQALGGAWTNGSAVWRLTSTSTCATGQSPACIGTADETVTTMAYPSAAAPNNLLPVSTTTGAGNGGLSTTTTMTHNDWGDVRTVDGPLSGTADSTFYSYDTGRRLVGVIGSDPNGTQSYRAMRITYNVIGQPTTVERGIVTSRSDGALSSISTLEKQDTVYDSYGRPVYSRLWEGTSIAALRQLSYDTRGRPTCTAIRMNPSSFGGPPGSACSLGSAGDFGPDRITQITYDAVGRVTSEQSGYGTAQVRSAAIYTYTLNGQVQTLTDARGFRTTYEYDGFDRLVTLRYPDASNTNLSSTSDYEQITYDTVGRVVNQRRRGGDTFTLSYDNLGRVTSRDAPGSQPDVTFAYDLLGHVTSESQPGHVVTRTYNALSRLTGETSSVTGSVTYQYDAAGRRTHMTYPDNFVVTYAYNSASELTNIFENGATSIATYGYDNLGRRISLIRGNGVTTSYTFDAESRLASLQLVGSSQNTAVSFAYNPAGQITSRANSAAAYDPTSIIASTKSYSANGLNQYTSAGGITPSYDTHGNLTGDGTSTYGYDYDNRLTSVSGGINLVYDPSGRLHEVSGGATTRFLYDGADVIAEYDASGAVLRRYVHGPGVDEPLVWYEGAGTSDRRWLIADERGSVIGVANGSGTVTQINKYDAGGVPDASNQGRFQYTGQMWIADAGLYYYKARVYHAGLGRFLQSDPIGYTGGMNLYSYVGNDPVNNRDPSGLACVSILLNPENGESSRGCDPWTVPSFPLDLVLYSPVPAIDPRAIPLAPIVRNSSGPAPTPQGDESGGTRGPVRTCMSPAGAGRDPVQRYVGTSSVGVPIYIYHPRESSTSSGTRFGRYTADGAKYGSIAGATTGAVAGGTWGAAAAAAEAAELSSPVFSSMAMADGTVAGALRGGQWGGIGGGILGAFVGAVVYYATLPSCFESNPK